jgi:DNA modification methylase
MPDPYYRDEQVTLYHGDCLEIDEWLSADVLVTDPPYGIRWEQSFGGNQHHLAAKKSYIKDAVAGDTSPVVRDEALALWGKRPAIVFGSWRIARPQGVNNMLIWHKAGGFSGVANCAFFTNHEEVYILGSGAWRKSAPPLMSVVTTTEHRPQQVKASGGHPTSKPVTLMERLVDRCPPGVIADPFAGSGSTLVAARNQGRKSIGVELEEQYCELIAKRLSQACFDFGSAS